MIPRSILTTSRKSPSGKKNRGKSLQSDARFDFTILSFSDELLATILEQASVKGVPFVVVQGCRQLWRICRDSTYKTVWKSLCQRLSKPWAVQSKLLDRTLTHASAHAGGWRSLCYEKVPCTEPLYVVCLPCVHC
eukprot:TRINITY_DN11620_c0_g1_i1.p1 TRINITY_DN11620_c0_g1~~TRINITY_DN11620_c0_g1_i1.p1  ORF type:complete len:135 (-),score=10.73 TRINITY_DN11620_c0_g1_i1:85-489(-)